MISETGRSLSSTSTVWVGLNLNKLVRRTFSSVTFSLSFFLTLSSPAEWRRCQTEALSYSVTFPLCSSDREHPFIRPHLLTALHASTASLTAEQDAPTYTLHTWLAVYRQGHTPQTCRTNNCINYLLGKILLRQEILTVSEWRRVESILMVFFTFPYSKLITMKPPSVILDANQLWIIRT